MSLKKLSISTAIVMSLTGASLIFGTVNAKAATIDADKQTISESSSQRVLVSSSQNASAAIEHFNQGLTYFDQKQYRQAIASYNKAIKFDRKLADAYNNRGVSYALLKNYKKGIADLKIAIRLYQQQGNRASAQKAQNTIQIIKEKIRLSKVRTRPSNVSQPTDADRQAARDRAREILRESCPKRASNLINLGVTNVYCDSDGRLQFPRVIYRR